MRSKLLNPISTGLVMILAILAEAAAQPPAKPLTQEELQRQIEGVSPPAPARRNPVFAEQREDKSEKPAKKAKGPTEIVALEATFDQKAHLAVFTGDVVVTDPEFSVQSDKLTAYLKHEEKPGAEAAPARLRAPVAPVAGEPKSDPKKKSSGLEKAIAEADPGSVVTVTQEKKEPDGSTSRSVGHGKKVVFDSVTGDITLTGKPDVQQGLNTCVATDESTIMILNRDGHMRVTGPHKTIIKDQGDLNK